MALFFWSTQILSRKQDRSAVRAAAYRAACRITEERTGKVHDYRAKQGLAHSEILCPAMTPDHMRDRATLWNMIEAAEVRYDAQVAREIIIGLPHELSLDQNIALARRYVAEEFVARGMIADLNVHLPDVDRGGDERNIHAHIMLTLRKPTPTGLYRQKTREWNALFHQVLPQRRADWERYQNEALQAAGLTVRVDARSLADRLLEAKAQGDHVAAARLDRQPQIHVGPIGMALARQGQITDRVRHNTRIIRSNRRMAFDRMLATTQAAPFLAADRARRRQQAAALAHLTDTPSSRHMPFAYRPKPMDPLQAMPHAKVAAELSRQQAEALRSTQRLPSDRGLPGFLHTWRFAPPAPGMPPALQQTLAEQARQSDPLAILRLPVEQASPRPLDRFGPLPVPSAAPLVVSGIDVMVSLYRAGLISKAALMQSLESAAQERAMAAAQRDLHVFLLRVGLKPERSLEFGQRHSTQRSR